jgi:23S rRNA pseudouridine2605 synthase
VPKTYVAEVEGLVPPAVLRRLRGGVTLDDGPITPDKVKLISSGDGRSLVEVTVHEGRNRIVRRLFDAVGHPVRRLARTAVGPVKLGSLPVGKTRELGGAELGSLLDLLGL